MTTVAQKQATPAQLITDLASAMAGLAEWSDADTDIVNDQSTDDWFNNGRVFEHSTTGTYLLFYVSYNDNMDPGQGDQSQGVRFVRSDSWDAVNDVPDGKTTVVAADPFSGSVTNQVVDSFVQESLGGSDAAGLWPFDTDNNVGTSRSDFATNGEVTYFLSATADGVSGAVWNTTETTGSAGWYTWQHVDSKFWADGFTDVFEYSVGLGSNQPGHIGSYAFQWAATQTNENEGYDNPGGMDAGQWGYVNADAGDDTFFVQYPIIYTDFNQTQPVAFAFQAVRNLESTGAAHGDTINYDGKTYRVLNQSGNGQTTALSIGVRYE